jgi:hypothetical protein
MHTLLGWPVDNWQSAENASEGFRLQETARVMPDCRQATSADQAIHPNCVELLEPASAFALSLAPSYLASASF